jgi:hypothetical protein
MWMSPLFTLSPVLCLVACLFCLAWQYCNSKSVSWPSHHIIQGQKKLSMCNLWPHACVFHTSFVTSHLLLSHAVPCSVCPSPSILSCHTCIQLSQKVCILGWWYDCMAWCVLFESHPPFERSNCFSNSQIFRRVVKFGKLAVCISNKSSIIEIVSEISPVHVRFIAVVSKM